MSGESTMQVFGYEGRDVRVVQGSDGEPRFVAADVCAVLELGNVTEALRGLDEDERGSIRNPEVTSSGGNPNLLVITEAGLYSLVMRSRKPEAKAFRRWVTHEVLPAIRKHGGYLTPEKIEEALLNPDVLIRLATDLKAERAQRLRLEAQIQDDRPKVLFADAVSASSGSILVRELAKLLCQNGVDIGGTRLFEWLRREGFLIRDGSDRNSPTQRSMDAGLMTVHETVIQVPDKAPITRLTPRITGKGQRYFVARFQREQPQSKAPGAAEGVM